MKYFCFFCALVFLLFAAIQINDPDPLYWMVVYGAAGLVALGRGVGRTSALSDGLVMGLATAGMIIALPGMLQYVKSGQWSAIAGAMGSAGYVEPAREFLGLLIVMGALVWFRRR